MNVKTVSAIHWSFWGVGVIGLIFNLMGCINFIMQMNADMVASMPEVYRVIIETRPVWATGAFAIAVFGGTLGCLLLLLRKSVSVYVFVVSLGGAFVAQIPFLDIPLEALIGGASQLVVGAFLVWYSRRSKRMGWTG